MNYAINLSPQVETLDGHHLLSLVALWLEDAGRTKSTLTHSTYETQIGRATDWWSIHGADFGMQLSRRALETLAAWLLEHGYSWHAQNDALRRLRQCLHWAFEHHYIPVDCSSWVPAPVGDKPLVRRRARLDDLERLLSVARKNPAGARDEALIALLIGTGVRRAEAAGMDIADVQLDADQSGTVLVRNAKRVRGRDQQGRVVVIDRWTGRYLARWLAMRPADGPLWVRLAGDRRSYSNERIQPQQITKVVSRAAKGAGIDHLVQGPHDLRRAFATWFASQNRGNPIAGLMLSRQLGHSNWSMTEHYILDDEEALRDVIRSPLAARRHQR